MKVAYNARARRKLLFVRKKYKKRKRKNKPEVEITRNSVQSNKGQEKQGKERVQKENGSKFEITTSQHNYEVFCV